jgi:sugar lactone lactonase YvrE
VKMTQPVTADGRVYRVTPDGQVHLVASGLFNPNGVRFVGNALWVTDVNGDFIVGKRELPDGFIVEIRARR